MKYILIFLITISIFGAYKDFTKKDNPIFKNDASYNNYLHYLEKNGLN